VQGSCTDFDQLVRLHYRCDEQTYVLKEGQAWGSEEGKTNEQCFTVYDLDFGEGLRLKHSV
jgi:hypothetical protein